MMMKTEDEDEDDESGKVNAKEILNNFATAKVQSIYISPQLFDQLPWTSFAE